MKSFIAIAALAAYTNAAQSTFDNCLEEQGTVWLQDCRSLWYGICDNYTLLPNANCNIETFGDASINWFSDSVEVFVWNYIERYNDVEGDDSPANSEEWGRLRQDDEEPTRERECQAESLGNDIYHSEQKLQARNGNCGFKFQVINTSEGEYDFTVLRSGSEALAATIVASAAMLALY